MEKQSIVNMESSTSIDDLLTAVRMNGIIQDLETTNKIADILGSKTFEEIKDAAAKDMNTFFFMIKYVWSMRDIIDFYNIYFNKEQITREAGLKDEIADGYRHIKEQAQIISEYEGNVQRLNNKLQDSHERILRIQKRNKEYEEVIHTKDVYLNEAAENNNKLYAENENLKNKLLELKSDFFDKIVCSNN